MAFVAFVMKAVVQPVTLLCFGLVVPCHSWGCLLQRNHTHHSVEPCTELDHTHDRRALALSARQTHLESNAPAGHGAAPAAPAGHGAAPAAPAGHGPVPPPDAKSADKKAKPDPTATLRIELAVPTTIKEIHEGSQGPLSHFLLVLQQEVCKSAGVPLQRISLLGIRGEYTKLETMLLDESAVDGKGDILLLDDKQDSDDDLVNHPAPSPAPAPAADLHAAKKSENSAAKEGAATEPESTKEGAVVPDPAKASADHEVIIDMEILPGPKTAAMPASEIFEKIKGTLENPQSSLRAGPLGGILASGELSLGRKPTAKDSNDQKAHEGHAISSMPNIAILMCVTSLWYSSLM